MILLCSNKTVTLKSILKHIHIHLEVLGGLPQADDVVIMECLWG